MANRIIFLLAGLVLCSSCAFQGPQDKFLDDIETYVSERPDSALKALSEITVSDFASKSLKARHSLLYAMALDKSYIDTTDINVILPAVEYYKDHGTPDEKVKAYYYLGTINLNAGNKTESIIALSLGEKETDNAADDKACGLLFQKLYTLYSNAHNQVKELEYIDKAIDRFSRIDDTRYYNFALACKAKCFSDRYEWERADSLYAVAVSNAEDDPTCFPTIASMYARMKMLSPMRDAQVAISLLDKKKDVYGRPLTARDRCVYAFALAVKGERKKCDEMMDELALKAPETDLSFWKYRLAKMDGAYSEAMDYLEKTNEVQDKLVKELVTDSLTQDLQDYFKIKSNEEQQEARILRLRLLMAAVLSILGLILIILLFQKRQERKDREMERLYQISEETTKILRASEKENQSLQTDLESLRNAYASLYKERYAAIGNLCDAYLFAQNKTNQKEFIYSKVEKLVTGILNDNDLHDSFESQINKDLGDIVKHLKEDLPKLDKEDVRFMCYSIVGFDPQMISTVMGWSLSKVYTKKSRLKDRIRALDSPYKEDYLRML